MDIAWVNELSAFDRRVLVLISAYETARKACGQFGYKAFREMDSSIVSSPVFKQFKAVTLWLDTQGWTITWNEVHWQGYVRFCFEKLAPTIPMPGQLKNQVLLKQYILSAPGKVVEGISEEELEQLYARVLVPEIAKSAQTMAALGLRGFKLCNPSSNPR